MEIVGDDDRGKALTWKWPRPAILEIDGNRTDARRTGQGRKRSGIAIDREHVMPKSREVTRMPASAAGEVQDRSVRHEP